jgi:membrane-associated protein
VTGFDGGSLEAIQTAIDVFLHLDQHLGVWSQSLGPWLYVLLFAIVFCETGLVVTPFLPGDSLLFAAGALCSVPDSGLSVWLIAVLLIIAAVLGDAVNYAVGNYMGPKVFSREDSRWLNKKHLQRTHEFYEKYGGKTIILARFVPIVRTFAPFVAGAGAMNYKKFIVYNVVGAVLWVVTMLGSGWMLGQVPWVKEHFEAIVIAIVIVSVMPMVIEFFKVRAEKKAADKDEKKAEPA